MNTLAILLSDTYKQIHNKIYPKGLTKLVSYWTPRRSMLKNQNKMVFFGLQAFIEEYLINYFNKNFFELTVAEVEHTYKYSMDIQLGNSYDLEPIIKLHKLGYLPIQICAIPEGTSEELLGTCDAYLLKDRGQIVLSLFAQNKYGYDGKQYTDLEAFRYGLRYISQHFGVWREKNGLEGKDLCRTSVALPYKIGCGRGGADWEMVYKIIEEELKDYDVELWRLDE